MDRNDHDGGWTKDRIEALVTRFREDVVLRSGDVDPDNLLNWPSLAVGWAIAQGLSPKQAREFEVYWSYLAEPA